jgi:hypothetical protein
MAIQDNFNRASLGAGWATVLGSAWVTNGSATARPASQWASTGMRRTESAFPDDQYAQAKVECTSGGESCKGAVAVRMDGSGNCYFVRLNNTTMDLYKRVAGSESYLLDAAISISLDTLYTVKITVTGNLIKAFLDGVEKLSQTDNALTSGKPGCYAQTGASSGFGDWDDFECTDAVGAGSTARNAALMGVGQ